MKRQLALAGIMLASAGVVIATPASASDHVPAPCSLERIVNARLDELGRNVPWTIGTSKSGTFAVTYDDEVIVSRETPCDQDLVVSIVNHEWVHTKQYQVYHTSNEVRKAFGGHDEVEKIADCGSQLLGSKYTPYIDQQGPCTTQELSVARNLIELPARIAS